MSMKEKIIRGSNNVFADIDIPEPDAALIRSQIISHITEIINERGLKQVATGKMLSLGRLRVPELMNGKLSLFSLEHLYKLLNALGHNVEIIIKSKSANAKVATTSVVMTIQR